MKAVLALLLSFFAVVVLAQEIPDCTEGMAPWRVEYGSGYTGLTPAEACTAAGVGFAASTGTGVDYAAVRPSDGLCQLYYEGDSGNRYPIAEVCKPKDSDEDTDFEKLGITPESILKVWTWGFASVIGMFFTGLVVSMALAVIRKA